MDAFKRAVLAQDSAAVDALLADDIRFTSPAVFRPYEGKAVASAILRAAMKVLVGFHYVREIHDANGRDHAMIFKATVGDLEVNGCDFIHVNQEGLIDDFVVMVRPLSAVQGLATAMAAELDRMKAEAPGI